MLLLLLTVLIISALLGYWVISKVPSLLHTPLMSGMNALSGVTILGAIAIFALVPREYIVLAGIALVLAMVNVAGGFYVTERMLRMFRKKHPEQLEKE